MTLKTKLVQLHKFAPGHSKTGLMAKEIRKKIDMV